MYSHHPTIAASVLVYFEGTSEKSIADKEKSNPTTKKAEITEMKVNIIKRYVNV